MLCLRCRALPSTINSYAAARPALGLLTRPTPLKPQQTPPPTTTTRTTQQTRPFSSILTRLPQSQSPFLTRPSLSRPINQYTLNTNTEQTRLFSASASLAAKRRTYNPSRRVQKRRHGFLARLRTRGGRKILANRRAKGKKHLSW